MTNCWKSPYSRYCLPAVAMSAVMSDSSFHGLPASRCGSGLISGNIKLPLAVTIWEIAFDTAMLPHHCALAENLGGSAFCTWNTWAAANAPVGDCASCVAFGTQP